MSRLAPALAAALLAAGAAGLARGAPGPAPRTAIALGGVRPETSALLLSGGEGGDLRLAIAAIPQPPGKEGKVDVALTVEVDGAGLLAGAGEGPLGVELSGYALDAKGGVGDFFAEGVRLELPADGPALEASGLRYRGRVTVAPGPTSIRVLVRSRRNGAFGVRRADLDVPAKLVAGGLQFAPCWLPDETPWLTVDAARPGEASMAPALPVIAPASTARILLAVPRGSYLTRWRARIAEEGGGKPSERPLVELGRRSDGGLETMIFELPPLSLPLGAYRISIAADGKEGVEIESPATRMLSPGERAVSLWPALATARAERLAQLPAAGKPLAAAADLAEYRRALAVLAAGDQAGALGALAAFEVRVLTDRGTFEALEAIEQKVLDELLARSPEALLPVALLHDELIRRYLRDGRAGFPKHAVDITLWIAEVYGRTNPEATARALAVVLSLAGTAIDAGAPKRASALFARAAELDPTSEVARLGRAAVETRLGNLTTARGELEELLRRQPQHREARLRLALLEARGGGAAGERSLRELLAPGAPADWVTALAYQELARLLLGGRRADEALALLREGAARLPEDPGVLTEYAYALDRRGERAPSLEPLRRLAARPPAVESARHRYSRWPDEELRAARHTFEQQALLRLPQLQAALAGAAR